MICLLGATGSIGQSTLEVVRLHPEQYQIHSMSVFSQLEKAKALCSEFTPEYLWVPEHNYQEATKLLAELPTQVVTGVHELNALAAHSKVDQVVAAIVGSAGLQPTFSAVSAGKKLLLANKESLVVAGELLLSQAAQSGALILPVDSEHNAIFQCLDVNEHAKASLKGVSHISLTASGGPFRGKTLKEVFDATPEQACAHPNWSMGAKISVDSATLVNKGLELIEASLLFGLSAEQIKVVVHPQSVLHSAVHYVDGSVLAELGEPDMKTPIAHALAWPKRISSGVKPLDFTALGSLDFELPDLNTFKGLKLATQACSAAASAPLVFNAANEVAVEHFLNKQISFGHIAEVIERTLQQTPTKKLLSLQEHVLEDQQVRKLAALTCQQITAGA